MIQISDISQLASLAASLTSTASVHGENWNDDVFQRIDSQQITPILSQLGTLSSEADSAIRQIVAIYAEMVRIASGY